MDYLNNFMASPTQKVKILEISDDCLKKQKVFIVALCGGQGSGKTKLSKVLNKNVPRSAIIEEKNYYKSNNLKRKLSYEIEPLIEDCTEYSKKRKLLLVELSDPNSYDYDKLYRDLTSLKGGKAISMKILNEETGDYLDEEKGIDPKDVSLVIIEGYFLFRDKKIKDLIDLKIYVEIDDDVRLSRLLLNENKFLKNNPILIKNFFMIYKNYIKTAFDKYIYPTKSEGNLFLPNYIVENDDVIDKDDTLETLIVMLNSLVKKKTQ